MTADRVLVTGASGFIAKHCIAELLRAGYVVRGTVRSFARRTEIESALRQAHLHAAVEAGIDIAGDHPPIELVEADLEHDGGWVDAAAGCRYVLHLASPFPSHEPRDPAELIRPARDGALRVLRAAAAAGAERVVQTSSVAAVMHSPRPAHEPRTEEDWTDPDNPDVASYARSKTLAERAAWQVVGELAASSPFEFCTINPGVVLGPALDRDLSTSHVLLRMIGRGSYPALPRVSFPVVDVRDVAIQHVTAMTHPAAAGQRWLSTNGTLSLYEIGRLIVAALPDLERKVPTLVMPSAIVRIASAFDRNLKSIRADLDKPNLCDNRKSVTGLGMEFRSAEEAVTSAAQSLRNLGII